MDFNSTIDIIIKDLEEIREIIDDFRNYPGVPLLQVELAKSKCRSAEEVISLLKILKPAIDTSPVKSGSGKEGAEKLIEIAGEESAEEHYEPEIKEKVNGTISETKVITGSQSVNESAEKQPIRREEKDPVTPPESRKVKKGETLIFADTFNGTQPTLLDRFGDRKDNGLSEIILKSQPVSDLTEAIGLNDRFLFIRELFGGNRQSYEEAIEKMNSVSSFSDARAILMSYTGEGEENEVVRQLLEIVKRKLPANE